MQVAQNPKLFTVNNFTIRQITKEGIQSFKQAGFKLVNRINCPQTSQVYQPQDVKRAQEQKGMLNLVRDLLIFKR